MARKRKYESQAQTQAFLAQLRASMLHTWKVGDKCLTYDLTAETTVVKIEGEIATIATAGKYNDCTVMHVSKLRLPDFKK